MQKTAHEITKYSRNESILKIGHLAKAVDFAKLSVWVINWNGQKHAKNDSTSTLELFCAKSRSWNNQIFEKWKHFGNGPCGKGYRVCKMVSLGQKLKWPKTCKNDSTSTLELFCGKNRSWNHQIFQKWKHFENRPYCKGYRVCKMVILGQKLKLPKTCEKRFYEHIRVFLCKKPLIKTPNIPQMRAFWKWAILQRL